jgi:hypothetical protein
MGDEKVKEGIHDDPAVLDQFIYIESKGNLLHMSFNGMTKIQALMILSQASLKLQNDIAQDSKVVTMDEIMTKQILAKINAGRISARA